MGSDSFISFILAMAVTMALIPMLMRASRRLGMVDHPEPRKVHERIVPRVGGLAMLAGLLVSLMAMQLTIQPLSRPVLGILLGILVVAIEGAWDDARTLGYLEKFAAQTVAALCVVVVGGLEIRELVLTEVVQLPAWLSIPLSVLVIVALTNAVNLADGLDGLAGGVSFFSCATLAVMAYVSGNLAALYLAAALCGALLGFLRFNTHPAVVFMGDGGSQLLGLAIASLAILVTQGEASVVSATTPLFLLAIPIIDTVFVMVSRVRQGRSPFSADRNHLHHRMLTLGFSQAAAVALIYSVQAALLIVAYLLRYESDVANLLVFTILAGLLLTLLAGRGSRIVAGLRGSTGHRRVPAARLERFRPTIQRVASVTLWTSLILYCALGATTLSVPADGEMLLWLLAGLFAAILLLWPPAIARRLPMAGKVIVYVVAATLAHLFVNSPTVDPPGWEPDIVRWFEMAIVTVIALSTVVTLRFSNDRVFEVNTMDLLVLFTAIVIPNLPGAVWGDSNLANLAARVVVLFYALEVVLSRCSKRATMLPYITAALTTGVLTVKGLIAVAGVTAV